MNGDFDLASYDFFNPPMMDVTLPSDFVDVYSPYYNPISNQLVTPPQALLADQAGGGTSFKSIADLLGLGLKTAGQVYTTIAGQKYGESKYVFPNQTGLEKQVYLPASRVKQTGLDMGILSAQSGTIAGIPISYLIIGAIVVGAIFLLK